MTSFIASLMNPALTSSRDNFYVRFSLFQMYMMLQLAHVIYPWNPHCHTMMVMPCTVIFRWFRKIPDQIINNTWRSPQYDPESKWSYPDRSSADLHCLGIYLLFERHNEAFFLCLFKISCISRERSYSGNFWYKEASFTYKQNLVTLVLIKQTTEWKKIQNKRFEMGLFIW